MLTAPRRPWRMVAALTITVVPCVVVVAEPSAAGGPPVVPAVSVYDATVVEGDSGQALLEFIIALSEPPTVNVDVDVMSGDGSATVADNDYLAASIHLTFTAGSPGPIFIFFPVTGDTQIEPDETLQLNAANAVNATIADGTGVGTIDNDDAVVALDETAVSVVEGNSGTTDAVISGVLSSPLASDLDLPGTLTDGSATEGSDFASPVPASLHIPAGSTSGILSVPVNGDTDIEPDETFTVGFELPEPQPFRRVAGLTSAVTVGGTLEAEVTIINDDVVVAPTTSTTTTTTIAGPTTSTTTTGARPTTTSTTTSTDLGAATTSVPAGTLPATRWRN